MNRRHFFATLFAPFIVRLSRLLPQRDYTYITPWVEFEKSGSYYDVRLVEWWIRDDETGEYRRWPERSCPYWHGKDPVCVLDLRDGTEYTASQWSEKV